MPTNKINKPVRQLSYQWHTLLAGQTITFTYITLYIFFSLFIINILPTVVYATFYITIQGILSDI